jgi:hypothetical protein
MNVTKLETPVPRISLACRIAFILLLPGVFTACHLANKKARRPVEPAKLSAIIAQADKIAVFEDPTKDAKVLFSSREPDDIAEFNAALLVVPAKNDFHCMCLGTPAVRLYRGKDELALVTNHHGRSIRCSLWSSDAMLKDPEKWLHWFDAHNIAGPRKEVNGMAASAKERAIASTRWLAAMPTSVRPLWTRAIRDEFSPNVKALRSALAKEFPDAHQRVCVLFSWYGSGAGPWSGHPSYESLAEELLLDFPTPQLVAAAEDENLSDTQLEGAARLFGGGDFSQRRPDEVKRLPSALKKKLLEHCLKSTDEDKLGRARHAFPQ